jgi:hypothetical protein
VTDGPAGLLDVTEMDPSWAWAAGAMVSSTPDLAHFYEALLGGQLLDPKQLQAMQATVDASQQFGHGGPLRPWADAAAAGLRDRALGARRGAGGLQDDRLQHLHADRQLVACQECPCAPQGRGQDSSCAGMNAQRL